MKKQKDKSAQQMRESKHDQIFTLVKDKDTVIICVGEYKAHKKVFKSFQEADAFIATKPYSLIFNTFQILQNYAEKSKNAAEENQKDAASN